MKELIMYLNKCKDNKFFEPKYGLNAEITDIANVWLIPVEHKEKICKQLNEVLLGLKRAAEEGTTEGS